MSGCNETGVNIYSNEMSNSSQEEELENLVKFYTMDVAVPFVCGFGMLGNVLNFLVLTREKINHSLTKMEKSANIGLIGLAVSDFMFCFLAFLFTQMPFRDKYLELSIVVYYQMLGSTMITWFIITSTWLTVVMAGERYLAVCHPFKARKAISLKRTRTIIAMIYAICFSFSVPLGFEKIVTSKICNGTTFYSIDNRPEFTDKVVGMRRLAWAILFDFIPCIALLYFNTCLIYKIHHAKKLRQAMAPAQKKEVLLTNYPRELFSYKNSNQSYNSNSKLNRSAVNKQVSTEINNRQALLYASHMDISPAESLCRLTTPPQKQMKARRRQTDHALNSVTATLVAVVVLFLILVSPSEILKLVYTVSGGTNTKTFKIIKYITNFMQAVNFSVHFILYCVVNKSFRTSFAAIFCFLCKHGHRGFKMTSSDVSSPPTTADPRVEMHTTTAAHA